MSPWDGIPTIKLSIRHVSVGWDSSSRAYRYRGAIMKNNTPENLEKALREAKAFVDAHPDRAR